VLPRLLVAIGTAMVLAGVLSVTGFPPVFSVGELDQPGKAVAAPFEKLHAAQRQKIKEAMSAPFVLGISRKRLDAIAECESHGNPRAIGGGGLYRGKYQFHRGTWASVGGTGDPARASELEQDRRAAMLIKQSGSNPWPICG
jgi:Transglycosylase-like domain